MNQTYSAKAAKSVDAVERLPAETRLLLLAQSRMDQSGHATFDAPRGKPEESELRKLMGHVNTKTGERVLCATSTIMRAKKRLAAAGLLVDASGGLVCVWVATEYAMKGKGGSGKCPFHRMRKRGWANDANAEPD